MRDDTTGQLECRVCGIISCAGIRLPSLVNSLWNVGRSQARNRLYLTEEVGEHILPVAKHVNNDATALLLAVIPGGALRRLPIAFENPVTKFPTHTEYTSKESALNHALQLEQSWQEQLVLHDSILDACSAGHLCELNRCCKVGCDWLLAVNVLPGTNCGLDAFRAQRCSLCIEVYLIPRVCEAIVEISAPTFDPMCLRKRAQLVLVPTNENRVGYEHISIRQ